ncbi:uncharacterized protein HMPREF1541_03214 [Cyphellophora europaea CBS 101466]|uniref:C2H2-type domain-containing protein n=1 Tax=Cyphellophora europaea (strain CBS 101466) TaxID=1220924 RepID=W2S000_CYPE1|nr:uncharacterized protein HMPREF1541_03214 [Cyphellophora europaea CBS 101466]ETN41279.1 hypothetical protein HMPREF1541_03214 [Cyphellophora europaea CBS 101466]
MAMTYTRHQTFSQQFGDPMAYQPPYYHHELHSGDNESLFSRCQPRFVGADRHAVSSFNMYEQSCFSHPSHAPHTGFFPASPNDNDDYSNSYSTGTTPRSSVDSSPREKHYKPILFQQPHRHDQDRLSGSVEPVSTKTLLVPTKPHCIHPDCLDASGQPQKFFSRKADVGRHVRSQHERNYIDCPKNRCARKGDGGFTRQDHLKEHLRQYHQEKLAKRASGSGSRRTTSRHV